MLVPFLHKAIEKKLLVGKSDFVSFEFPPGYWQVRRTARQKVRPAMELVSGSVALAIERHLSRPEEILFDGPHLRRVAVDTLLLDYMFLPLIWLEGPIWYIHIALTRLDIDWERLERMGGGENSSFVLLSRSSLHRSFGT